MNIGARFSMLDLEFVIWDLGFVICYLEFGIWMLLFIFPDAYMKSGPLSSPEPLRNQSLPYPLPIRSLSPPCRLVNSAQKPPHGSNF